MEELTLVLALWRGKTRLRGVLGIFVAHVFAIQMLCASIVATQMAIDSSSAWSSICQSAEGPPSDSKQSPDVHIGHVTCGSCLFATTTATLPGGDGHAVALTQSENLFEHLSPFCGILFGARTPRLSQGPPVEA